MLKIPILELLKIPILELLKIPILELLKIPQFLTGVLVVTSSFIEVRLHFGLRWANLQHNNQDSRQGPGNFLAISGYLSTRREKKKTQLCQKTWTLKFWRSLIIICNYICLFVFSFIAAKLWSVGETLFHEHVKGEDSLPRRRNEADG